MRLWLTLLLGLAAMSPMLANPPDIQSVSPDKTWIISAHWVKSGKSFEGYDWNLLNVKTGKAYFHEEIQKDEALPHELEVKWAPDSHYAGLTIYFGRALQVANVLCLSDGEPQLINPLPGDAKNPLEKTLIQKEDLPSFTGYNRLLTGAGDWLTNTDLSVEISMLGFLEDKTSGKKYTLVTTWHRTVHFEGKSYKVIESTCDSYEKRPETN